MHLLKALSLGFAAGILAAVTILPASAQVLEIMVTDNLGHSLTVADGSAGDSNPNANAVSIDSSLLGFFPNLIGISNVTASFSQPGGNQSRLTTTGDLFGNTSSIFTINSSINWVVNPAGLARMFNDTNTVSFNNSVGTSGTDRDGVHTGNVLHGQNISDTPFTYNSTGALPNSGAGMGPGFVFLNTGAFAITSTTVISVVNQGESQYTTNSIIQTAAAAVPEPGALATFAGLATIGMGFIVKRRRSKTVHLV